MSNQFDTTTAPTTEPSEIIAGDFTRWRRTDLPADYPTADYDLSYECRREGTPNAATLISLAATVVSAEYLIQITGTISGAYTTGLYHWFAYITRKSDSERVQVDSGQFEVKPNRADDASDPGAFAKRLLNKIEEAIEGRANNFQLDTLAYSLGTETSATRDPGKLLEWRMHFRREVRRLNDIENIKKGRAASRVVRVRF